MAFHQTARTYRKGGVIMQETIFSRPLEIGNTGIYINPQKTAESYNNWLQNTPEQIRQRQIDSVMGFIGLVAGLYFLRKWSSSC